MQIETEENNASSLLASHSLSSFSHSLRLSVLCSLCLLDKSFLFSLSCPPSYPPLLLFFIYFTFFLSNLILFIFIYLTVGFFNSVLLFYSYSHWLKMAVTFSLPILMLQYHCWPLGTSSKILWLKRHHLKVSNFSHRVLCQYFFFSLVLCQLLDIC